MYNIKYISYNNLDYRNMQKVYFSCHPDDRELYLDMLTKDIFKFAECAVFYDEKPEADYDRGDYENMLLSSSLIVVPVTSNFLFKPNRSRDVDMQFAAEHFIPVIPVMLEPGLEQHFNREKATREDMTCALPTYLLWRLPQAAPRNHWLHVSLCLDVSLLPPLAHSAGQM